MPHTIVPSRRHFLIAGALTGLTALGGCIGSFGLTDMLFSWNKKIGGKWIRALVFLGLVILPVYSLFLLVDAIALNVVEFWTGKHPVGGRRISKLQDGREVVTTATDDPNLLKHEVNRDGVPIIVIYTRRLHDDGMEILDEDMRVLSATHVTEAGVEVRDGAGAILLSATTSEVTAAQNAMHAGLSPSEALRPMGDPDRFDTAVASAR